MSVTFLGIARPLYSQDEGARRPLEQCPSFKAAIQCSVTELERTHGLLQRNKIDSPYTGRRDYSLFNEIVCNIFRS